MLPGNKGRAIDVARIAYLGGTPVALEKEWLRPSAGGVHRRDEKRNDE